MAVGFSNTNKPINPRGQDASPLAYNRAKLYSGKALDFDGVNDYVDISTFSMSGQDGSFCFYYKQDADSVFRYAFDMIPTTGVRVAIVIDNGQLKFLINNEALANQGEILNGEPNFCVITSEGTTQNFYINGQFIGSQTSATYISLATTGDAAIGSRRDGAAAFLDGQIAGFKIFNTALTAAQVADLYNNPEKIVPTGVSNTALKLWLPMMEGAGTTVYDGSGNGNHGTISGATYVNGVGAPVSQSAVMDWNKGTNILEYSIWNNSYWTASGGVVTDGIEAPDGTNTAFKFERDGAFLGAIYKVAPSGLSSTNYRYVYAKLPSGTGSAQLLSHSSNTNNTFTITDEWQRFELNSAPNTAPSNFYIVDFRADVGVDEIHLWAPQAAAGTDESVFVPTIGTAQPNPVLLPQGLTTGRDITGVNLFENVRKQGALNLDGNSWAEVHDNASLDITSAITLEAWYYHTGSGTKIIQGRWSTQVDNSYLMYVEGNKIKFVGNDGSSTFGGNDSTTDLSLDQFNHVVITYDRTNLKYYLNGVLIDTFAYTVSLNPNATVALDIGRNDGISGVYTGANYNNTPIAQPRIYNRALTAAEVLRNYNSGKNTYK